MTAPTSPGVVPADDVRAAIEAYNVVWQSWPAAIDNGNVDQVRDAAMYTALMADHANRPSFTEDGWHPIETAPKDGTAIDLWHGEFGRFTDHHWGKPDHTCGEAGRYCDSDWHSDPEGWVDASFNELSHSADEFTHWRLPPVGPRRALADRSEPRQEKEGQS